MAALSFFILGICGNRVNHLFSQIPFILDETKNYDCCFFELRTDFGNRVILIFSGVSGNMPPRIAVKDIG